MKPTWLAASILCFAATALAQDSRQEILLEKKQEKAEELSSYEVSKLEARFLRLERVRFPRNILERGYRGIRPLVGGMPSGSGFVLGVGYLRDPDFGLFRLEGNARYSTRSFAELDAGMEFPSPRLGRKLHARVNTTYQDYTSLGFFGLGNDSSEESRTFFGQKNKIFGGGVTAALSDSFELTGDVDRQRVEIEGGERDPSLETVFGPISVPGFTGINRDFNVFRIGATLRLLDQVIPSAGITLSGEAQRYDDRDSSVFNFYRFVGEVKAYVPLGYRNRMLAMRLRTSHASADDSGRVPFYMMETLGGARTIRGFREYRFRDTRNILINVEYRWEVWTHINFAVFFDAGKVFSDASDTDFTGFHTGYGFGVRVHGPGGTIFRVDLARSTEGYKLHIGAGPSF